MRISNARDCAYCRDLPLAHFFKGIISDVDELGCCRKVVDGSNRASNIIESDVTVVQHSKSIGIIERMLQRGHVGHVRLGIWYHLICKCRLCTINQPFQSCGLKVKSNPKVASFDGERAWLGAEGICVGLRRH